MSDLRRKLRPSEMLRNVALLTRVLLGRRPEKTTRALLWGVPVILAVFALVVTMSPSFSSESLAPTATRSITFPSAGKYIISLPGTISSPTITKSEELFNALDNAVGCNFVARHVTLDDSFVVYDSTGTCKRCNDTLTNCVNQPGGIGCDCFCVDPAEGRGFFVDVGVGTMSMTASDGLTLIELEAAGIPSASGTNFISLPYDSPLASAKDLFREIGNSNVQNIQRFITSTEQYQLYTYGTPDFALNCSEGYIVKMGQATTHVPSQSGVAPPECSLGGPPPCDQSPFPTCDGDCPADQVCNVDASGMACACEPIGSPCQQCGPGPHFIDACGPFPPVGTDLIANNGAVVGIDLDLDCVRDVNAVLRPCPQPNQLLHVDKTLGPIDDSANFPGTSPVDGHPTGPGLDVIDTEIVSMCLTNGAITMAAGAGGPSSLQLQPSLGTVAEDLASPDPTQANSKFDVFFEVSGVPGGPLYNQVPLEVTSTIDCLPPKANYHHPVGICVPLTTSGTCVGGPNDGNVCVNDLDCPGGTCDGTFVMANLVSANHSVNQPVCSEELLPECDGDCPPNEVCTDVGNTCDCVPLPCEAGPFPECAGTCPPGTHCQTDDFNQECICVDDEVPCEQGPFPVCQGPCPPDTHCAPDLVSQICNCVPDIVPCDLSDPSVCDGFCPNQDDVCNFDPLGGPCSCGPPQPVPCVDSVFPTCNGDCPPDQECAEDDAGLNECVCRPIGSPCAQCGPGPHFVDMCGPFPPVGTDLIANNGAVVGIDIDFDCVRDVNAVLRPCPVPNQLLHVDKTLGPIDDSANFPGTSPVDGHPTGPGLDVIDTEIVSMCLTNGAITMAAGAGGPSALQLQPSLGTVAEDLGSPDPTRAASKFDVFFEVSGVMGGPLYNQVPLEVTSTIDCLPPAANYHHPAGICVPLTTSGICVGGVNGGSPCISDLDCAGGGTCSGTFVMANLVSANHSVNQPVCSEELFPECDGDCPPNEICLEGPTGCSCEPILPPPCEQSAFPECDGACPPGTYCSPDPATDRCECLPLEPPLCSDTFFPVCDGSCPPNTRCAEGGTGQDCECRPCDIVVPGPVKQVNWLSIVAMIWDFEPCSGIYNAYRHVGAFSDLNGDGLADAYGSCFQPALPGPPMFDPTVPPPGEIHYYVVTGESPLGEGSMGLASNRLTRPNTTPCP